METLEGLEDYVRENEGKLRERRCDSYQAVSSPPCAIPMSDAVVNCQEGMKVLC